MISQIEIWFNKVGFHVVSCFVSISSCHVHRWGFRLQSAPVRCVDQSARPSDSGLVRVCVVGSSHCLYFVPWFCSVYVGSSLLLSVTFILSCFDGDKFVHSVFWWVKTLHTSAICPFWEGSLLPAHTCDTIRVHTLAWHILRNTTSNKKSLWIFFLEEHPIFIASRMENSFQSHRVPRSRGWSTSRSSLRWQRPMQRASFITVGY